MKSKLLWIYFLLLLLGACSWKPKKSESPALVVKVDAVKTPIAENVWGLPDLKMETSEEESVKASKLLYAKWMNFFQSESDPLRAYEKLLFELKKSKPEHYPKLFESFSRSPAFLPMYRKGKVHLQFVSKWVEDALKEKNKLVRELYGKHYYLIKPKAKWMQFYLSASKIKPGGTIKVHSIPVRLRMGKKKSQAEVFTLKLAKLVSTDGIHEEYKTVKVDTLVLQKRKYRWQDSILEPGIYRISIFNQEFVQEIFFQASWLDLMVTADSKHLFIWGGSYENKVPPPYQVEILLDEKNKINLSTDSTGIVGVKRGELDTLKSHSYNILLKKGTEQVFSTGKWVSEVRKTGPTFLFFQTDRETYERGQNIQFIGKVDFSKRGFEQDSLKLEIENPKGIVVLENWIIPQKAGLFSGSAPIKMEWEKGKYKINILHRTNDSTKIEWVNYGPFALEIGKKKLVAPNYQIEVDNPIVKVGDSVEFSVKGNRVFGGEDIQLYFKQSKTDSSGKFSDTLYRIEYKMPPLGPLRIKYGVDTTEKNHSVQLLVNKGGQDIQSPMVYFSSNSWVCDQIGLRKMYSIDETINGKLVCVSLVPKREFPEKVKLMYSRPEGSEKIVEVVIDDKGEGYYNIKLEKEGLYIFKNQYQREGDVGTLNQIIVYKNETEVWSEDSIQLGFLEKTYVIGDTLIWTLRANRKKQPFTYSIEGDQLLKYSSANILNGEAVVRISLDSTWRNEPNLTVSIPGKSKIFTKSAKIPYWKKYKEPMFKIQWPEQIKGREKIIGELIFLDTLDSNATLNYGIFLVPKSSNEDSQGFSPLKNYLNSPVTPKRTFSNFTEIKPGLKKSNKKTLNDDGYQLGDKHIFTIGSLKNRSESNSSLNKQIFKASIMGNIFGLSARKEIGWKSPAISGPWDLLMIGQYNNQPFFYKKSFTVELPLTGEITLDSSYSLGDQSKVSLNLKNLSSLPKKLPIKARMFQNQNKVIWDTNFTVEIKSKENRLIQWNTNHQIPGRIKLMVDWGAGAEYEKVEKYFVVGKRKVPTSKGYKGRIKNSQNKQDYRRLDFDLSNDIYGDGTVDFKYSNTLLGVIPNEFLNENFSHQGGRHEQISQGLIWTALSKSKVAIPQVDLNRILKANLPTLIKELVSSQHGDGGWSWGETDSSDVFWSSWIVQSMKEFKDVLAEEWVTDFQEGYLNGIDYLQKRLTAKNNIDVEIMIMYALGSHIPKSRIRKLIDNKDLNIRYASTINLFKLISLAKQVNRDSISNLLIPIVKNRGLEIKGDISWPGDRRTGWMYHSSEVTALGYRVLAKWFPKEPLLDKVKNRIKTFETNFQWGPWKSRAEVFNAVWFNFLNEKSPSTAEGKFFVNGQKESEFNFPKDSLFLVFRNFKSEMDSLRIVFGLEKPGSIYFNSNIRGVPNSGLELTKSNQIKMARSFFKINFEKRKSSQWEIRFDSLKNPALDFGEFIKIDIGLKLKSTQNYLVIKTPIPPGLEPISEFGELIAKYQPDSLLKGHRIREGEFYSIKLNKLDRGDHKFRILFRGNKEGKYNLEPSLIMDEFQGVLGVSPSQRVIINKE